MSVRAATERLLNQRFFDALPPAAMFINVGRAATVDHTALVEALVTRQLRAAVLDVAPQEPLPPDSPLWRVRGLTLTPHISGVSDAAEVTRQFLDNLARLHSGEPLLGTVSLDLGY